MTKLFKTLPVLAGLSLGIVSEGHAQANTTPTDTKSAATTEDLNWEKKDGIYAVFTTPKGKIVCQLEYQKVPLTVGNFVALCEGTHPNLVEKKPFYDGIIFHRVIPNFMIQGGDAAGSGKAAGVTAYSFSDEFDPSLRHTGPGTLSMANAGPHTNNTQIFITHVATPWLDNKHSIFGHVVLGQSVVNAIAQNDKIESVRISRIGAKAKAFDAVKSYTEGEASAAKKAEAAAAAKKIAEEEARKKAEANIEAFKKVWDAKVIAKYPTAKKTATGLYYVIDKEGTGAVAQKGQTVVAHYTGTLWDGAKFDSSRDRGTPFEFPLGMRRVIAGWDEGFGLMKVGSVGKLIIPYYLAYGESGRPPQIPASADLIFDVEMINIK